MVAGLMAWEKRACLSRLHQPGDPASYALANVAEVPTR